MSTSQSASPHTSRIRSVAAPLVLPLLLPVGLVVLWWWTSRDSGSFLNPPLREVVGSLREDWLGERIETDLLPSLRMPISGLPASCSEPRPKGSPSSSGSASRISGCSTTSTTPSGWKEI